MLKITDNLCRRFFFISIICLFAYLLICLFVYLFRPLPPQMPLFYSRPWGESQIGSSHQFFLLPLISFFIFLFNILFASLIFSRLKLASQFLITTNLIAIFLLFFTFLKILFLIT